MASLSTSPKTITITKSPKNIHHVLLLFNIIFTRFFVRSYVRWISRPQFFCVDFEKWGFRLENNKFKFPHMPIILKWIEWLECVMQSTYFGDWFIKFDSFCILSSVIYYDRTIHFVGTLWQIVTDKSTEKNCAPNWNLHLQSSCLKLLKSSEKSVTVRWIT